MNDRAGMLTRHPRVFMQQRRAFHLIELVIVIVVVSIATVVTVPKMASYETAYRLDLSSQRVAEDIENARRTARFESTPYTITFSPTTSSYTTWNGRPAEAPVVEGPVTEAPAQAERAPGELDAVVKSADEMDAAINDVKLASSNTRIAYDDQGNVLARQMLLASSPFKSVLLSSDFGGETSLTFDGFGELESSGQVVIGVKDRARSLDVSVSGALVTTAEVSKTETETLSTARQSLIDGGAETDWTEVLKVVP